MYKALAVMVRTPHIRAYLEQNDPMALRQAEQALAEYEAAADAMRFLIRIHPRNHKTHPSFAGACQAILMAAHGAKHA